MVAGTRAFSLRERTFPGDPGLPRKAGRSRRYLPYDQQPRLGFGRCASQLRRGPCNRLRVGRGTHVQDRCAAYPHERQAPLERDRRGGQRLRDGDTEALELLLLRPAPYDGHVWELGRGALQERGLPLVRLEERHMPVGQRSRERNPGRAAPRPDVDDLPLDPEHHRKGRQRLLDMDFPGLLEVSDRGQPWGVEQRLEPGTHSLLRACVFKHKLGSGGIQGLSAGADAGTTTTYRFGSTPSLSVPTPGSSLSRRWTTLRSIEVIGSSPTGSPPARTRSAAWSASVSSVAFRRSRYRAASITTCFAPSPNAR